MIGDESAVRLEGAYRRYEMGEEVVRALDGVSFSIGKGERVAIMGSSYGGYAALMGAVRRPDLYKAAISICGVGDPGDMLDYERRVDDSPDSYVFQLWVDRIGDPRGRPTQGQQQLNFVAIFRRHLKGWSALLPLARPNGDSEQVEFFSHQEVDGGDMLAGVRPVRAGTLRHQILVPRREKRHLGLFENRFQGLRHLPGEQRRDIAGLLGQRAGHLGPFRWSQGLDPHGDGIWFRPRPLHFGRNSADADIY